MKKYFALLLSALMLFSASAFAEAGYPVYQATARTQEEGHFFDKVPLELFNQSGQASYENISRQGRHDLFTFADQAQLSIGPGYVSYTKYDGEYYMIYGEDPQHPGGPFPRPSFAAEIGYIAASRLWHAENTADHALVHRELTGITLADADAKVQELLASLCLTGYELITAVDMDVSRIREWGVQQVEAEQNNYNVYDRYYDFASATGADEGYYLIYGCQLNGLPVGNPDGTEDVRAFVNADGIATFELRSSYAAGDVYSMPEQLLTEEEIRAAFEKDNERRIENHFLDPAFTKATLMYCPMRAPDKKDGMVLTPAYYIDYTFVDGSPTTGWAWYSAVDGKLIADCY